MTRATTTRDDDGRRPFRAAPAALPDAFGIVILPARSDSATHKAPTPRLPLRALLGTAGNRG
ncbi:MAG: hypothetical protein ABW277_27595 [Longimicrobiaceae bacterium]